MVIAIIGESCTGKSTLAEKLKDLLHAEVYTGKDYLRLAKNEATAKKLFQKRLDEASDGQSVIYVISEKEHLPLLPQKAFRVLVTADLDVIQEMFAQRIGGELPAPVAAMLEKNMVVLIMKRMTFMSYLVRVISMKYVFSSRI